MLIFSRTVLFVINIKSVIKYSRQISRSFLDLIALYVALLPSYTFMLSYADIAELSRRSDPA